MCGLTLHLMPVRCSCGEHDLPEEGPFNACHFCGHVTRSPPIIDWEIGKLWYPICHACAQKVEFERQGILVHEAPPELVARAEQFNATTQPRTA